MDLLGTAVYLLTAFLIALLQFGVWLEVAELRRTVRELLDSE